jgi:hypothetical protein
LRRPWRSSPAKAIEASAVRSGVPSRSTSRNSFRALALLLLSGVRSLSSAAGWSGPPVIGFAGLSGTSRPRTSSGWRSSKGSSGKETRPSGDRQARVRWAPSDGPASDRRPLAQMAPAPSEPRATTFSSRAPAVHRPFGLFSGAADLLVPAQVAHPRAPDPRAARTDRGSRESVEAGAVTLRLCLHCGLALPLRHGRPWPLR